MSEQMRSEFEKHTKLPDGVSWCNESQKYVGNYFWIADYGLSVWTASRAALCVELPKRAAYEQLDSAGVFSWLSYEINAESAGDTVELLRAADVADAIHAAGVKTK